MRKFKKVLSVLLAVTVLLSTFSINMSVNAEQATRINTETENTSPLDVEVTTNKSKYWKYDIAEITVKITNTSEETIENISAEAVFNDISPIKKDSETFKEVESLKADESFSFSYKATISMNKLNFFEKIALWFVRLFNGGFTATENNFDDGRKCITENYVINFGNKTANNEIKVWLDKSTQEISDRDFNIFQNIRKSIENMSESEQVIEILETEIIKGNIIDYQVYETYITFNTTAGINGIWQDETFFSDGNKSVSLNDKSNDIKRTPSGNSYKKIIEQVSSSSIISSIGDIAVIRPYRSTDFKYDDFLTTGEILADTLGKEIDVFDNADATLSVLKSLEDYGVILIDSHGALIGNEPYISLTESYDNNGISLQDYNSIVIDQNNQIYVKSNFFENHYENNDFNECCVFLGICYGMYDTSFSDVLIEKGVDCVYGYTDSVSVSFCNETLVEIMLENLLLDLSSSSVAYNNTVSICGQTDPYNSKTDFVTQQSTDFYLSRTGYTAGIVRNSINDEVVSNVRVVVSNEAYTATGITDKEGLFKIKLPVGIYNLTFEYDGYTYPQERKIIVEEGVLKTEGVLYLYNGNVYGYINDSSSNTPIANVRVEVIDNNSDSLEPITTATTDESGQFSLSLPYGSYSLSFKHDSYEDYGISLTVDSDNVVLLNPVYLTKKVSFAGGDGTEENPYQVATPKQLNAVRNNLSAHYIQIADIDMSDWGDWEPIGCSDSVGGSTGMKDLPEVEHLPFTGFFDGNNKTISGLTINNNEVSFASDVFGLFGVLDEAVIKNVNLIAIDYDIDKSTTNYVDLWNTYGATFNVYVGGLIGKSINSTVDNCTVSGSISVTHCNDAFVGGVIGYGNLTNCINKAEIYLCADKDGRYKNDSSIHCGGLTGHSQSVNGNISSCGNYGNIVAYAGKFSYVGGISGEYGKIENCVNYGDIVSEVTTYSGYSSFAGNCNTGGIVGATSSDYTRYCVNYGSISGKCAYRASSYVGGIVGYCGYYGSGKIYNCINISKSIISTGYDKDGLLIYKNAGRICGINEGISKCYSINTTLVNNVVVDGDTSSANGKSCSNEELLNKDIYIDFDFDNIWRINENIGGAVLR